MPGLLQASDFENIESAPIEGYPFDHLVERAKAAGTLLAGSAAVDITPRYPKGMYMAGFGPQREARGVADPIFARALVLADPEKAVALVTLDVIGVLSETSARIGAMASAEHPENILVVAVHNHDAPDTIGYWGPALFKLVPVRCGVDPDYLRFVERMAALAVHRAANSAVPAELKAARVKAPGRICRRLYKIPAAQAAQQKDTIFVMSADDKNGDAIATWIHYDCHAETLWERNQLISADWPGEVCKFIEWIRGGTGLVTMGPLAGREPEPVYSGSLRNRFWHKRQTGRALAETAFQGLVEKGIELESPRLRLRLARVKLKVESKLLLLAGRTGVIFGRTPKQSAEMSTRLGFLEIGPVKIALVPGEFSREAAEPVKDLLGGKLNAVVNLFDTEIGYVLTEDQFSEKDDWYMQYLKSVSFGKSVFGTLYSRLGELATKAAAEENQPGATGVEKEDRQPSRLGPPADFGDHGQDDRGTNSEDGNNTAGDEDEKNGD
ncbi:MAG: hypothetical protein GXP49_01100 [Deltaproteobacteria bacterium]|nr:hypothetical protein [Deltaproteobacteria bacterium]